MTKPDTIPFVTELRSVDSFYKGRFRETPDHRLLGLMARISDHVKRRSAAKLQACARRMVSGCRVREAFMLVTHPRLGADSGLGVLSEDLLAKIGRMLGA